MNCGAHCRGCGTCFSSTKSFDAHRDGSHKAGTRHCCEPSGVAKLDDGTTGVCKISSAKNRKTTIFSTNREAVAA